MKQNKLIWSLFRRKLISDKNRIKKLIFFLPLNNLLLFLMTYPKRDIRMINISKKPANRQEICNKKRTFVEMSLNTVFNENSPFINYTTLYY